jgi:putative aldouronate transport system substrate-binding protein
MLQTGESFDLMFTDLGNFPNRVAAGGFADLTDLVKTETPKLWASLPQGIWAAGMANGKLYAVPNYKDTTETVYYVWDKATVDKYGAAAMGINDTTLAGVDKTFRFLKQQEPNTYPASVGQRHDMSIAHMYDRVTMDFWVVGVKKDDKSRKVVSLLDQPDIIQAFDYFHRWQQDGILPPDVSTNPNPGNGGHPFTSAQGWPGAASIFASWNHNEAGTIPVEYYVGPWYSTDSVRGSMVAIGANSTHKKEALKVLELLHTDPIFRDMLGYGIEGKHFTYVKRPTANGGGVVKLTHNPDWQGPGQWQLTSWFSQNASGATIPLLSSTDDDQNKMVEIADQNARAKTSVMMGFSMDMSSQQLVTDLNNCKQIWEKYNADLLGGMGDPAQLRQQAIADLNAAGLQRVITEAQKQVDAWSRNNPL